MQGNRLPLKILEWEPEWTRRRGRSKDRWIDGVRRSMTNHGLTEEDTRIHPMALQLKSGLSLLYWGSITVMFYGVRLLASRPTPVNFGGPMIFCWGLLR
jgi:hypothetical protein